MRYFLFAVTVWVGAVAAGVADFDGATPVQLTDGTETPLREIRVADKLLAYEADGRVVTALVERVTMRDVEEYLSVETDVGNWRVTPEQLVYAGNGQFKETRELRVGDYVYTHDGRDFAAHQVRSIEKVKGAVRVYRLELESPRTFFAHRIAVRADGNR